MKASSLLAMIAVEARSVPLQTTQTHAELRTLAQDFITDGWNWFDSIVVTFSLVSFFHPAFEGVNILRLIRALRVFRLFRKLKSLGKILMAIQSSLPAVTNAFFLVSTLSVPASSPFCC